MPRALWLKLENVFLINTNLELQEEQERLIELSLFAPLRRDTGR